MNTVTTIVYSRNQL